MNQNVVFTRLLLLENYLQNYTKCHVLKSKQVCDFLVSEKLLFILYSYIFVYFFSFVVGLCPTQKCEDEQAKSMFNFFCVRLLFFIFTIFIFIYYYYFFWFFLIFLFFFVGISVLCYGNYNANTNRITK